MELLNILGRMRYIRKFTYLKYFLYLRLYISLCYKMNKKKQQFCL